jgi:hypothetical protein
MANSPQIIHGYGVPSVQPNAGGSPVLQQEVTIPFLNYHTPTAVFLVLVLLLLLGLHLLGLRFGAVVGASVD